MLRDVVTGLVWTGFAFAYFAFVMSLSPLQGADGVWDLLVILGGGITAIVFLHVYIAARDDRRLRVYQAKMDEQDRRARETARASALRLNAYLPSASRRREHRGHWRRIRSDGADHPLPVEAWAHPAARDRALAKLGLVS
jgi:hypothetical protein